MYAYSLFSLAFAKCPLNVFSALAFVSILGGFGKFTYLIGGIPSYINYLLRREKYMKFLQKLGKALMLPVAVLPICGILMGIG